MEQLEFELWIEKRITPYQQATRSYGPTSYVVEQARMFGRADCFWVHDLCSGDMIVRYKL